MLSALELFVLACWVVCCGFDGVQHDRLGMCVRSLCGCWRWALPLLGIFKVLCFVLKLAKDKGLPTILRFSLFPDRIPFRRQIP